MRTILKYTTGRVLVTALVILLQLALMVTFYMGLWNSSVYVQVALRLVSIAFVLVVFNSDSNPAFKTSWTIVLLTLPLGWLVYLTFHGTRNSKKDVLPYYDHPDLTAPYRIGDTSTLDRVSVEDAQFSKICRYIQKVSGMGLFQSTDTKFYPCGEYFFVDYLESLRSAKRYVFLEYFIVSKGAMWNAVLDILKDRVAHGVEVRILYDDMGTISLLPHHYDDYLNTLGIKALVFNPIQAFPSSNVNFRDHRKVTIIDGTVAYTGGLNLSDEYINRVERFGYWKDSAIRLQGSAVRSMVAMYLQLWNYCSYSDANLPLNDYFDVPPNTDATGYVQPFYDNPFYEERLSKNAYLGIINGAKRYVYVCTPYLILDQETVTALTYASLSGVDVRIITPHVPDKKNVYEVTRSNYLPLLRSGVRIFEFRDGFIHSKAIVSDDKVALVGTANFDFRSFYMHFEDGILMYRTKAVLQVRDDCVNVFKEQSIEVLESDCVDLPAYKMALRLLIRLFSPLM